MGVKRLVLTLCVHACERAGEVFQVAMSSGQVENELPCSGEVQSADFSLSDHKGGSVGSEGESSWPEPSEHFNMKRSRE